MVSVCTKLKSVSFMSRVVNRLDDLIVVYTKFTTTTMCFVAGTMVHTANGLIPIEQVRVGDLVLSRDELTGE